MYIELPWDQVDCENPLSIVKATIVNHWGNTESDQNYSQVVASWGTVNSTTKTTNEGGIRTPGSFKL